MSVLPTVSREQIKEANVKNYDEETVGLFLKPNFQASAKLAATRFLQFHPPPASPTSQGGVTVTVTERQVEDTVYTQEALQPFTSAVDNVDRNVWPADGKVLDFGCGAGLLTNVLLHNVAHVVGVDVAPEMMKAFKIQVTDPRGEGHLIDILDEQNHGVVVETVGQGFDCAVSTLALHHVPDLQQVAESIQRYLKPGGWFFTLDFDGEGLHDNDLARARAANDQAALDALGIVQENLDPAHVGRSFAQGGLQNVTVERGFQLEFWFDNDKSVQKNFSSQQKAQATTRVNANGVTEYLRSITLAMVAGQKPKDL